MCYKLLLVRWFMKSTFVSRLVKAQWKMKQLESVFCLHWERLQWTLGKWQLESSRTTATKRSFHIFWKSDWITERITTHLKMNYEILCNFVPPSAIARNRLLTTTLGQTGPNNTRTNWVWAEYHFTGLLGSVCRCVSYRIWLDSGSALDILYNARRTFFCWT